MSDEEAKRRRILVVEDDEAIRRMLELSLRRTYDVAVAENGPAALAIAEQFSPQLLMLDVMLPGMTGFEIAEKMREVPGLQHTPKIFLTAKDDPMSMAQGIQSGARHYITKPFNISDVLKLIERIFRLMESSAPNRP